MTQVVGALAREARLAFELGNTALTQGRVKVAVRLLDRAFRMEPCIPTLHGYVMAALAAEDWVQARRHARLLTREDSANAEPYFLLGAAYHGLGQWEKAENAFRKCVSRNHDHIGAHQQLAQLAGFRGDRKAEMYHATAALTSPVTSEIDRYWQSTLQLWSGDYANGWRNYETRHGLPLVVHGWRAPRGLSEAKRWAVGTPVPVTLLAYASQGHGDAIQMARYLPELATRCAKLIVMVHGSLVQLFERQARGRWRVMALDAETPEHDAYVDMMSLPYLLGTDEVGKIPAPADFDEPVETLRQRYGCPLHVALCTQGGKVASLDLDRSDHTGSLATLKDMPGVEWVDFTGRTGDWLDTARELATCDLLISVDSALAHLAGSLGVETWLVPPTHFEWRHLNGAERSVWYPNMTYYRRTNTRDWPGVTARIRADLERRING